MKRMRQFWYWKIIFNQKNICEMNWQMIGHLDDNDDNNKNAIHSS